MTLPLRLLDTTIVVRYLTGDIPGPARQAQRLIESDAPIGVTAVCLVEAAYVLTRPPYAFSRAEVVDALVNLVQRENVECVGVERTQAIAGLLLCRPSRSVSFGDAMIAAIGRSAGVDEAYSFDRRFGRAGVRVVPPPVDDSSN